MASLQPRRLSDDIVEQLETLIAEGTFKAGERLPAERVLAEQFGVSRPSLREALQKLVARGLLVSRQGGGNYVSQTLGRGVTDPLLALLESQPSAHRDLLEFRAVLEGACAYQAARRATAQDHQRLQAAHQALEASYANNSRQQEGGADAHFHLAIAEASHNLIYLHTMKGLFDLLKRNVVTNIGGLYQHDPATREQLRAQHAAIVQAILAGEAEAAKAAAEQHIHFVEAVLGEARAQHDRDARAARRGTFSKS